MRRFVPYRLALAIAFLVQIGLVGWMIADRALLLANGRELRLAVVPVDPRDLVRGDYVTLTYAMSRLDSSALDGDDTLADDEPVYVSLKEEGESWVPTAIHAAPPAEGTWMRGTVTDVRSKTGCSGACAVYSVEYNIEKFFVPEGTGRELEKLRNDQRISVDIALASNGRAALKRLLVDGEPRYDEPFL